MITVEDINSVISQYGFHNIYHEIDTSKISLDEYSDVKYDFCICGHTIDGVDHTFTFKVENSNWTGMYFPDDSTNSSAPAAFDATFDSETNTITYETRRGHVKMILYCNSQVEDFLFKKMTQGIYDNVFVSDYAEIDTRKPFDIYSFMLKSSSPGSLLIQRGLSQESWSRQYLMSFIKKIDYNLDLDANLTLGRINKVSFTVPSGFDADCVCTYLDKTSKFKLSDGEFSIDLTDYEGNQTLNLTVQIFENNKVLSKTIDYKLPVSYVRVSNYADLVNQILAGASIVELTADITCYDNIYVNHDLLLMGNDFELDLDEYSFSIASNHTFKMNNVNVINGNPVILQRKNSQVDLTSCSFTGATNSKYNNLGSVISCDLDIDSLDIVDDFITNIRGCSFINNHNVILHGGTLNITNCKYHNTDMNLVDVNNPAFLYQTDGIATITDSIFDIDYTSNAFNESNINYGQALFTCGINALINNASHDDLGKDNSVNWCNAPYNNRSHIYAKYYYPSINEIVISSPIEDMEDKALCYAVSGLGQVFKSNVQITRDSMKNDNITRKIIWEEIE